MSKNLHLSCHSTRHLNKAVSLRKCNHLLILKEGKLFKVAAIQFYVSSQSHKSLREKSKLAKYKCSSKTRLSIPVFSDRWKQWQVWESEQFFQWLFRTWSFLWNIKERGRWRSFQVRLKIKQLLQTGHHSFIVLSGVRANSMAHNSNINKNYGRCFI